MSFSACLGGMIMAFRGAGQQRNQMIVVILLALSTLGVVKHNKSLFWKENFNLMSVMILFCVS